MGRGVWKQGVRSDRIWREKCNVNEVCCLTQVLQSNPSQARRRGHTEERVDAVEIVLRRWVRHSAPEDSETLFCVFFFENTTEECRKTGTQVLKKVCNLNHAHIIFAADIRRRQKGKPTCLATSLASTELRSILGYRAS